MSAPILIAGPTASGKSALAVTVARQLRGVIVNADSQQVYAEWRVLTARPSAADEATAPHRLYGHVGVAEAYSVGRWLDEVRGVLAAPGGGLETRPDGTSESGPRPIVVGGTGLYFRALTQGLSPIPEVSAEVRAAGEAALERIGLTRFAEELARRDPETAEGLDLANPRRVLRAWEVLEATGTGLAEWKARTPPPLIPLERAVAVALVPPRDRLYARCDARLDAMIAQGALDEVTRVMALGVPRSAPAMKAVGAAELASHLAGELTLDEAAARAKTETRRYAKRQLTWIRNQMAAWRQMDPTAPGLADHVLALARA
ncbi:MAG TPA: tRNA (adenosine(37)-N6)-dimethylallyltransferase MiaA [Paracoccaceae bacterium]|nr:tRNA (adenosine(37)-N6)-dimethylallyltransferase MiaA [Paracoccaceae bacterium]